MSQSYMRRCTGKDRLHSRAMAAAVKAKMCASSGRPLSTMSAYHCNQCNGWHVGGAGNAFVSRYRRKGKRPNKRLRGRV